jgi:hypothetical protein
MRTEAKVATTIIKKCGGFTATKSKTGTTILPQKSHTSPKMREVEEVVAT